MKLDDLSQNQHNVLYMLYCAPPRGLTRLQLKEALELRGFNMPSGTVSSAVSRLEAYGLIDRPEGYGSPMRITSEGSRLFDDKKTVKVALGIILEPVDPLEPETGSEAVTAPEPAPTPEPEPESVAEPVTEPEPVTESLQASMPEPESALDLLELDQELIEAFEVEAALHQTRIRLQQPVIPATASRVYRELLEALPPPLVRALAPISAMIQAQD